VQQSSRRFLPGDALGDGIEGAQVSGVVFKVVVSEVGLCGGLSATGVINTLSDEYTRRSQPLDQRTSRGFPKGQYPLTRPRPSLNTGKNSLGGR
jgi:hypothetical protein